MLSLPNYEAARNCDHPKYCLKMATGTGKTWVLQALLHWQMLNAARAPEDRRFTKNFLVVAPGLIVHGRLLDAFLGKERNGRRDFGTSHRACLWASIHGLYLWFAVRIGFIPMEAQYLFQWRWNIGCNCER